MGSSSERGVPNCGLVGEEKHSTSNTVSTCACTSGELFISFQARGPRKKFIFSGQVIKASCPSGHCHWTLL